MSADSSTFAEVRKAYEAQRDAMVAGDTAALDALLDATFTLTHMTRHVQPKADWLAEIDSGGMRYHSIEDVEVTVSYDGGAPVLTARTLTDATIWGGRHTWRLRLRVEFTEHAGQRLVALRTVASMW